MPSARRWAEGGPHPAARPPSPPAGLDDGRARREKTHDESARQKAEQREAQEESLVDLRPLDAGAESHAGPRQQQLRAI